MKKYLSFALILSMIFAMTITVYATTQDGEIFVEGSIEPISLNVTVPTNTTFLITANRTFSSTPFSVINNSVFPVTVTTDSLKASTGNNVKIVDNDKFSDWANISAAETQSNISLGLKVLNDNDLTDKDTIRNTYWFTDESQTQSPMHIGRIKSFNEGETSPKIEMGFDAKYGRSWGDIDSIDYELCLTLEAD